LAALLGEVSLDTTFHIGDLLGHMVNHTLLHPIRHPAWAQARNDSATHRINPLASLVVKLKSKPRTLNPPEMLRRVSSAGIVNKPTAVRE
jgi:hypothetical protein